MTSGSPLSPRPTRAPWTLTMTIAPDIATVGDRLDGHAPKQPSPVFARQNLEASAQSFGPTS